MSAPDTPPLSAADLPRPNAPWAEISEFAGTYSGYAAHGGLEGLSRFARALRGMHDAGWRLPPDVAALRSALFFEQRSDHFSSSADDSATLAYIHALVEALRDAIRPGGEPDRGDSDPVADALPAMAQHLERTSAERGGGAALRERDLSDAARAALGGRLGVQVGSNAIPTADWPALGRSAIDVVAAGWPGPARHVAELKWCRAGDDKVYEAIWDLFKMALALRVPGIRTAHLITGAPVEMWPRAFCTDLFGGGTFTVEELCARRFARGGRRFAWDYLLEGGADRAPDRVPAQLTTRPVGEAVRVAGGWELRAVAVGAASGLADVPFDGGWPHGWRPADARRPA
jgi:hypothetical protein